jgi:UDP-glucose 4-epimerase
LSRAILECRELTANGDGGQTRDYVYVGDVVRANMLATEMPRPQTLLTLNIGTGSETSVNDLVRLLCEVAGKNPAWRHGPARSGEQRRSALDSSLANHRLGWEATTDLPTGLIQSFRRRHRGLRVLRPARRYRCRLCGRSDGPLACRDFGHPSGD